MNVLPDLNDALAVSDDLDDTFLSLDRNHCYAIFISYAEVYNEKVYDLLAAISPSGSSTTTKVVQRKALPLKNSPESEANGRYVGDLSQVQVKTADEAKALLRLGQLRRQVFGTLANQESSRSHAIAVVKVLRCHRGELDVCLLFPFLCTTLIFVRRTKKQ